MTLPFCGRGLCLRADVSFTALQAQFTGQILSELTDLSVLKGESQMVLAKHFQVNYNKKHNAACTVKSVVPFLTQLLAVALNFPEMNNYCN